VKAHWIAALRKALPWPVAVAFVLALPVLPRIDDRLEAAQNPKGSEELQLANVESPQAELIRVLAPLLLDEEQEVRDRAAIAIAYARGEGSPGELGLARRLLRSPSYGVAQRLSSLTGLAVPELTAKLKAEDSVTREAAALAFGQTCDAPSWGPLVEALGDPAADVRRAVLVPLAVCRAPAAVAPLLRGLGDTDASVREAAVIALTYLGGQDGRKAVEEALQDVNVGVRKTAVLALVKFESMRRRTDGGWFRYAPNPAARPDP